MNTPLHKIGGTEFTISIKDNGYIIINQTKPKIGEIGFPASMAQDFIRMVQTALAEMEKPRLLPSSPSHPLSGA